MWGYIEIAVLVFFLGAIPFAQLIASMHGDGNLKQAGTGNIGAANLALVAGRRWGLLAGLLDATKAYLPLALFRSWGWLTEIDVLWLGVIAMLGHIYSPFVGWRGGKGLSVAYSLFMYFQPWAFLGAGAVGAIAYRILGYVPGATLFFLIAYELIAQVADLSLAAKLSPWVFGIVSLIATVPDFAGKPRKLLPPKLRGETEAGQ